MKDLRILFVEDSAADVELATWELEKNGYRLTRHERVQTRDDVAAREVSGRRPGTWSSAIIPCRPSMDWKPCGSSGNPTRSSLHHGLGDNRRGWSLSSP